MFSTFRSLLFCLSLFCFPFSVLHAESLHIVTSLDPLEAKEYLKAFQEETKIDVTTIRLSAGEVLARLKAEKGNPTQSIWFGGPSLDYIAAKKEKLLQAYSSAVTQKMPQSFRDAEGFWTGIYFGSMAFVSYKPFLASKNIPAPTSWQDLLKPEFKNEIAVSFPYTSGTGFTLWAGLVQLMGEEKALEYWKGLDQNIRRYTQSGSGPVMEVAMGEAGFGIAFSQDAFRKATSKGLPVVVSYPQEGTPYEIGAVAILAGAKEMESAKKFVDWIASPSAQNLMHQWGRYPILPGAKMPQGLGGPKEVKLITIDPKMGLHREELLQRWRQVMGR
ncbi:MAG: ABC transporter substrate-binding protein [Deltaproteobacteria bacterium]|nr:ABC transporter substrate-binding protein [Deltaproteobacteria bacterium]